MPFGSRTSKNIRGPSTTEKPRSPAKLRDEAVVARDVRLGRTSLEFVLVKLLLPVSYLPLWMEVSMLNKLLVLKSPMSFILTTEGRMLV